MGLQLAVLWPMGDINCPGHAVILRFTLLQGPSENVRGAMHGLYCPCHGASVGGIVASEGTTALGIDI
jgi:hypothetical protein